MCKMPAKRKEQAMSESAVRTVSAEEFTYEIKRGASQSETETHSHNMFELILVHSGVGKLTVGARYFAVDGGDVILLPDGIPHSFEWNTDTRELRVFRFSPGFVSESVRSAIRHQAPIASHRELRESTELAMRRIDRESRSPDIHTPVLVRAIASLLTVLFTRLAPQLEGGSEGSSAVELALLHVNAHFGERISLGEVAALSGVSAAYLSRRFKEELGVGFSDYLSSLRLERAAEMLKSSHEMSVTEIAFSTGFNDSNYFSDKFKHRFGISPLRYRKRYV